jgi:hypothetical protein
MGTATAITIMVTPNTNFCRKPLIVMTTMMLMPMNIMVTATTMSYKNILRKK